MSSGLQTINRTVQIWLFKADLPARIRLWRKLGKLLADGIPIVMALEALRDLRRKDEPMYMALNEWVIAMKNGKKFNEVIKDWVSSEERMLMMAGDQAGSLPQSMQSLIKVSEAKQKIKSAVISGISYPFTLLVVTFLGLYLFNYKIVPAFTQAVKGANWTGMASYVISFSSFMQEWYVWIVLIFVGLVVGMFVSMPMWASKSRVPFDRHVPYSIYRVMQGSSWLIALSALTESGLRLESAMEQLMNASSPWAKTRIRAAIKALKSGKSFGQALSHTGYEFPDREIISDLHIYASKGGFDQAIKTVAEDWINEAVERIQKLMQQVFNVSLVLLTVIIGFEVAGILSMQMQFSSNVRGTGF